MVEIRQVNTKKEIKQFIEFPLKLYKGNPYFVPPLYVDELKLFDKDNTYSDQCDTVYFNAYMDGKMVGRISGILQRVSNEKWQEKRVRFTRFDSIDNQEVADALFGAVESWAKNLGMNEVVGPLGFSDLEREGLLVEGFDQLSTFEEQYNYPYYQRLIENCGYTKEVGWSEFALRRPAVVDERIGRISALMMKKYNLRFATARNTKEFLNKFSDAFFDILDDTYTEIYGTVPFTDKMKKVMIDNFNLIINMRYVALILDENDNVVCFGLCFPSIAKAMQPSGGRLTPLALVRLLRAIKHPTVIDLGLIGVRKEYLNKGISSAIIWEVMKMLADDHIDHVETNLNLDDNYAIINQWKSFDSTLHKRRCAFVKKM